MNTRKLFKAFFVATAVTVVGAGAVRSATASMEHASEAARLAQMIRPVEIDIWPRNKNIEIDIGTKSRNKAVEVALINQPALNYGDIDFPTIEFAGAFPASQSTSSYDANGDGKADRVYKFTTKDLKLTEADTSACFTAETNTKQKLRGCTAIKVIKGAF